jgi:hypothetical protein
MTQEFLDSLFSELQNHVREYKESREALKETRSHLKYMRKRLELTAQMLALEGIAVELPPMHPTRDLR